MCTGYRETGKEAWTADDHRFSSSAPSEPGFDPTPMTDAQRESEMKQGFSDYQKQLHDWKDDKSGQIVHTANIDLMPHWSTAIPITRANESVVKLANQAIRAHPDFESPDDAVIVFDPIRRYLEKCHGLPKEYLDMHDVTEVELLRDNNRVPPGKQFLMDCSGLIDDASTMQEAREKEEIGRAHV